MFKRIACYFLLFVFLIQTIFSKIFVVYGALAIDSLPAESYVLMDAKTGQVLFEKDSHEKRAIASLTKIMPMLLAAEKVDNGELKLDQKLAATEETKTVIPDETSLWLAPGEKISVDDLLKAVAIKSANDAARTLGAYLTDEGTQESCVELMNKKAKELKMNDTNFMNVSGLDEDGHYSSAYDVAVMTREILKNHGWIKGYTSTLKDNIIRPDFKDGNGKSELINTNFTMLKNYPGCTGFKTGTTDKAGKCLCSTAERNGMSLIAVCLGCAEKIGAKEQDTVIVNKNLLNYAFNNFRPLDTKRFKINPQEIKVVGGRSETTYGIIGDNSGIYPLVNKRLSRKVENKIELKDKVGAPIRKGDVVGKIKYLVDKKEIYSQDIVSDRTVEKIDWFFIFSSMFKNFFCCSNIN